TERVRCGSAFAGWAAAIAMNSWTAAHPFIALGTIGLALAWTVYLFWPEIASLKVVYPSGARVESPAWLYMFAMVSLFMALSAGVLSYDRISNSPRHISGDEFAKSYLQGGHYYITDFVDSNNLIEGRTFENC